MESYITVASNDISAIGCLVLCNSLKQTGTDKQISVIITQSISANLKNLIERSFDNVFDESELIEGSSSHPTNYELIKLKIWLLVQFKKCVYLESDTLVIDNIDDLFERSELSAVVNSKFLCFFDTGLLVIEPNKETYEKLMRQFSKTGNPSFSWILNSYFSTWGFCVDPTKRIPFAYNCQMSTSHSFYTQTASLIQYRSTVKVARLGEDVNSTSQNILSGGENRYVDNDLGGNQAATNNKSQVWKDIWCQWWQIYSDMVFPGLKNNGSYSFKRVGIDYSLDGSDSHLVTRDLPPPQPPVKEQDTPPVHHVYYQPQSQPPQEHHPPQENEVNFEPDIQQSDLGETHIEEETHQIAEPIEQFVEESQPQQTSSHQITEETSANVNYERERWERGEIDYMGRDRFNNIMAVLDKNINGSQQKVSESEKPIEENPFKSTKNSSSNIKKYNLEYMNKTFASNYVKIDKSPIKSAKSTNTKEMDKIVQKQIAKDKQEHTNTFISISAQSNNAECIPDVSDNNNERYKIEVSEEGNSKEPDEEVMKILGYREE